MITRYSAWMDGAALHEIDPAVYIMDIEESAPVQSVVTAPKGSGDGQFVLSNRRQSLAVTIRVMVHEYDTVKRKEIIGKIAAWATGGKYLSISDRPGKRLRVHCYMPPVTPSALKWTNIISINFTAYEKPYWEDETATTQTATGASGSFTLAVPGNAEETTVDVRVINNSDAQIDDFSITVGKTTVTFANLNLATNGLKNFNYDDDGIYRIPLSKRTPESSDDLLAECGADNAVSFTASGAVEVTVSARGRWL